LNRGRFADKGIYGLVVIGCFPENLFLKKYESTKVFFKIPGKVRNYLLSPDNKGTPGLKIPKCLFQMKRLKNFSGFFLNL